MIPRTLGWTPSLINEPHLWGASIPETLLQRQSCMATQVHHGDETLLEQTLLEQSPPQCGVSGWTGNTVIM